ncbi:hypothetical protein NE237_016917 [Protea cynaroides]|uniref:Uncharacterized protein n=1 Tax=Protea cynaroides TaxID=273540 RepID=A0A9Q0HF17_9MAGN|nr:hypothetical protein NE237_016917 [Protea cynaroides]
MATCKLRFGGSESKRRVELEKESDNTHRNYCEIGVWVPQLNSSKSISSMRVCGISPAAHVSVDFGGVSFTPLIIYASISSSSSRRSSTFGVRKEETQPTGLGSKSADSSGTGSDDYWPILVGSESVLIETDLEPFLTPTE